MALTSDRSYIKIDGQKELTLNRSLLEYTNPTTVAIPLKNLDFEDFAINVEVGDYVKIGTKLAIGNDHNKLPLFSSVSGTVTAIEKRDHIALKKANHIIIENDFKNETELLFEPKEIEAYTDAEIKEHMRSAGVLGLSGSGVPTFTKFRNTKNVTAILVNAIESEPLITADQYNISTNPELLIKGCLAIMKAADAKECTIVLTEDQNSLYENIVSLSKNYQGIIVKQLPYTYPIGFERYLIEILFQKKFKITPVEVGIISLNSSTIIEFAKTLITGLPLYERVITLAGNGYVNSQNVKVRIGTILKDIISEIGGLVPNIPKTARLVHGGPLRGGAVISDNLSVTPITNGFTCIFNEDDVTIACSRCGDCIASCPEDLQPIQIVRAFKRKDKDILKLYGADKCIECGICSYVCPSFIDVTDGAKRAKAFTLQK